MTGLNNITLRLLDAENPDDVAQLQRVLLSVPDYWQRIWGEQPCDDAARETFRALPPNMHETANKMIYGLFQDDLMIGCIDLVKGWPDQNTMMVGLVIIAPDYQRSGIGRQAMLQVRQIAQDAQMKKLRLGVIATNNSVLPFYKNLGFSETERKPFAEKQVQTEVIIMEAEI